MSNREDGTPLEGVPIGPLVSWIKAHRTQFGSDLKQARDAVYDGWRPDKLPERPTDWKARARAAEAQLASLQSERDELRKALEPFARFIECWEAAQAWTTPFPGDYVVAYAPETDAAPSFRLQSAHFHMARQALNPDGTGGGR